MTDYLVKKDEKFYYFSFQNKSWKQATWIESASSLAEVMDSLCTNWSKAKTSPVIEDLRTQWKLYIHQRIDVLRKLFDLQIS